MTTNDPTTFTEEQLSMIASALAGGQALCCVEAEAHSARDAICNEDDDDRVQDDCLRRFADDHAGCQLYKLSDDQRRARIDRYLEALMRWDATMISNARPSRQ